jgi:hypothetical protein
MDWDDGIVGRIRVVGEAGQEDPCGVPDRTAVQPFLHRMLHVYYRAMGCSCETTVYTGGVRLRLSWKKHVPYMCAV